MILSFGLICRTSKELLALLLCLDERLDTPDGFAKPQHDTNHYIFGIIGKHHVVIACLPVGHFGDCDLAITATMMISTFKIKRLLYIGTSFACSKEMHPGDVVIATDLVQCDMDRKTSLSSIWGQCVHEFKMSETVNTRALSLPEKIRHPETRARYQRKEAKVNLWKGVCGVSSGKYAEEWPKKYALMAWNDVGMGIVDAGADFLVVHGISGYADGMEYTAWQEFASLTSAIVAMDLIKSMPL